MKAALVGSASDPNALGVVFATGEAPDRAACASVEVSLAYATATFRKGNWNETAKLYLAAFSKREIALAQAVQDKPSSGETADTSTSPDAALFSDRLAFLRSFANAGANAALALLRAGESGAVQHAVLAMEQGLQQGLQESFDLIEIDLERHQATGRPGAERFRNARATLARLTHRAARGGAAAPSTQALINAREEFEAAIAEIQIAPGFEQFLRPVDMAAVRAAASASPLVYLGATEHGGLALLVPDADQPVMPIDLPELTTRALRMIAEPYEKARSEISDKRPIRPWLETLDLTLRELWELAMERLCAALETRGLTRAVLIPYGGALASLPWHAAFTMGAAGRPDERRYACDGIAWRYAPSARLIGPPRRWTPRRGRAEEALVVYHADSPGDPEQEVEAIRAALGATTVASGRRATPENARRAWRDVRYAHLIVHGHSDPAEPLNSSLEMARNRDLTIRDLLWEPKPLEARLFVLAACGSAVTSGRQGVDEIVSWPAALMRAGAHQVMASSWPVLDAATLPLMRGFYERLGQDEGVDLAKALLASARDVRGGGVADLGPAPVEHAVPFWRRLLGGFGAKSESIMAGAGMRLHAGHRLKVAGDDSAGLAAVPGPELPADPDAAPSNWNHPHFWAGFSIHGAHDDVI
jgi:CHAT domain-containing protein